MQPPDESSVDAEGLRVNRFLVSCGFESRRKADQLVSEGQVEINGKQAKAGDRVLPGDFVKVNGKRVEPKPSVTLLLNKPRGFVCSREPQGAAGTIYDFLPAKFRHVNYVGRLDSDSEGLILLTSKGQFGDRVAHPANGIEKEYWVTLDRSFDNSVLLQLLKGIRIPEGQAKAKYVARLSPRRACVVLSQGLRRQLRQMFACLGFRVRKLVRVRIGSLWGGDLLPGHSLVLSSEQESLALTNPKRRAGLLGATQAFPASGTLSEEQLNAKLNIEETRRALIEDAHYEFNPDDFESEEDTTSGTYPDSEEDDVSLPVKHRKYPSRRRNSRHAPESPAPRHPRPRRGKDASSHPRAGRSPRSGSRFSDPRRSSSPRDRRRSSRGIPPDARRNGKERSFGNKVASFGKKRGASRGSFAGKSRGFGVRAVRGKGRGTRHH